ncbi:unnamed protein product [Camellia sinensis]
MCTYIDPVTKEEKRGKERMVCNYKRLNDNTHKDQYSLPGINTIMAKIGHSKIYSKFDLKSGFHQVAMHPDSIEWTAFWTPLGLYEWLVMPFGLKNAPAVFQRKMDVCFKGTEEFIAVYIDDILVFSPDEQTHEKHIHVMIEVCKKNGLILSATKMKIAAVQMDFLGSTIGQGEIKLQAHIITKVANFSEETLKETKGLRSWLGLLNYARSYIKDLGRMLSPLYSKVSPKGERRLNSQDWNLIREIKRKIQSLPNLSIPPEGCVIILETDGCMEGWGGVCKWKKALKDPHSTERICAYASGKFSPIKSTIDAEIYACINSLEAFKIYYLDKGHLTLRTDCQAIISFFNKTAEHKPSRSRWISFTDYITGGSGQYGGSSKSQPNRRTYPAMQREERIRLSQSSPSDRWIDPTVHPNATEYQSLLQRIEDRFTYDSGITFDEMAEIQASCLQNNLNMVKEITDGHHSIGYYVNHLSSSCQINFHGCKSGNSRCSRSNRSSQSQESSQTILTLMMNSLTRGYENWQGGEANLLITRGMVGRLSNTPNVGFAYEIQGVTEYLTSRGVRAIPGERISTEELRGRNWIIQPPVRRVQPQQPTTAVTRNLPGGRYSISFGNYEAAPTMPPVRYDQNDNEMMTSDDESTSAVQREAESHTLAVGWDTTTPSTSTTRVKFDNFPDHFPTTSDDEDDDVPLGYDPQYEPSAHTLTDYPTPPVWDNPFAPNIESLNILTEGGESEPEPQQPQPLQPLQPQQQPMQSQQSQQSVPRIISDNSDADDELYFKAQRRRRQAHVRQNFPCPYKHCREKGLIEYEGITAVHFVKLCPGARMPSRATDGAVGYDLSATAMMIIQPQERCLIPTGIALEIPFGMYGRIAPRSGLALNNGIHVGAGVIDPDYRGEVKVLLFNFDRNLFKVQPGQRIAQIIFEKVALPRMVQRDGLLNTTRDTSGFGHSGMASEPKDSDSDSNSTLNIIAMMEEGETEYPQVKKLEQLIMKHRKDPQFILSSTSAVSNYNPPQDTMMGPPGYPPATGQGTINIPQRPTYEGGQHRFRNFRRDDKSEWWNLPSAMHSTGAMFILPHQLGKFDEVFMRWESITKAHVSMQGFTDVRDKLQYIENMLGETEKLIWTQWRMKYDTEFNNLITMGEAYKFKFQIPSYFSLVIRSLAVLEGIAISFDPNYKVLGSTYPWIARKVLTDSSPKLKASLQALLYKDGVFRIDRLESLLTEITEKKQVEDSDSRMMVKQILSFTLTEKGAFVREILLQEFAKGLDALGLATVDCITSAATAGLPFAASLSSSSMTEEDITNLRTFQRLVLLLSGVPKNESSNTGVEEANPYKSQRRNSGEEASLVLYQFASVQEILPLLSVILELPADLQQQVLRLPVDLTGKLMSRVAARTIRRAFL